MKFFTILSILLITSCSSTTWNNDLSPSQASLDKIFFEDSVNSLEWDVDLSSSDQFQFPKEVRPCCAFGTNHKVQFANLPVPLLRLSNTVSISEIGAHTYDATMFSVSSYMKKNRNVAEKNGLIVTKKGGVIDLAHIRDTADLTVALFYHFYKKLGTNSTINLRKELGHSKIELKKIDLRNFSNEERWFLSSHLAALKAYQMAVGHEIAQWHGFRNVEIYGEEASAYSPEDLYSNLLGAKIAANLINNKLALSTESYNKHMTIWIDKTLRALGPVSSLETRKLLMSVDGKWWNSQVYLPEKEFLLVRNYNVSNEQRPPVIPGTFTDSKKVSLKLTNKLYGINLDDMAQYSFTIDQRYRKSFSHIPSHLWKDSVRSQDFQKIVNYDRKLDLDINENLVQND